jgi:hypothetical protein
VSPGPLLLLLATAPQAGEGAPVPLRGVVHAAENGQPLFGARVHANRSGRTVETDRQGRFVVWLVALPDTLIVRMIGRRPDTVAIPAPADAPVSIDLEPSPTPIAAVTIYGIEDSGAVPLAPATSSLSRAAMQSMPSAVEADVLRSLALAPAVTFSTPLSAQPLIRGQDGGAASVRLDGFTLLNPYHIGRYLGAVTPNAVQAATVMTAPVGEEWGDATSGIVDIQMREGGKEVAGGAQLSFATASAWVGGPAGLGRWFVAARHAYFGDLPIDPLRDSPYGMDDVYGRFMIPIGRLPLQVTAFGSRDRIFNRETGDGMRWDSRLLGARLPANIGRGGRLEVWGELSAFGEDVAHVPLRGQPLDIRNRFSTAATGLRIQWSGASRDVGVGVELRRRHMVNEFTGGFLTPPDLDAATMSGAAFAGIDVRSAVVGAHVGVRVDADSANVTLQPRARLGIAVGGSWVLSIAAGRSAKLYHLISDPQPEPDPLFYDIWRPVGGNAPLPVADHALIELKHGAGDGIGASVGAFAGWLRGVGEVRLISLESGADVLRFGRGRLYGVEAEVSRTGERFSGTVSYVLSRSERRWPGTGRQYVPWIHDRRHQLRVTVGGEIGRGWRLTSFGDVSSPEPLTPIVAVAQQGIFTPVGVIRDTVCCRFVMIPGAENSVRGVWVGRVDLALTKAFTLGQTHGTVGLSVLNLSFTRVAPVRPQLGGGIGRAVTYKPLYPLPPIPTITLRLEF